MRRRQRGERRESPTKRALTDLQFLAELGVLTQARNHPDLVEYRDTGAQFQGLAQTRWIEAERADALAEAWRTLLGQRHMDWLRREPVAFEEGETQSLIEAAWSDYFPRPASD